MAPPLPPMIGPALTGLIAFFVMFAIAAWLLRKVQRRAGSGVRAAFGGDPNVRVLTRHPLAWQCTLEVVDVAGKQFAITVSRGGRVTLLGEVSMPVPASPAAGEGRPFVETLHRVLAHHRNRA